MYEIVIPEIFPGHGAPKSRHSRSAQWEKLKAEYRKHGQICVPQAQFAHNRCVQDEAVYRLEEAFYLRQESGPKESGCIVVGLESPHVAEFEKRDDGLGNAIAPLQDPRSREGLARHLGRLLYEAALWTGENLIGKQIVLANSIQYQASLQSLMTNSRLGLQKRVRNCVWHMIWNAGGKEDFRARLNELRPVLILMAPTAPVREALAQFLNDDMSCPWLFADRHPCLWLRKAPHLREEPRFRWRPTALHHL